MDARPLPLSTCGAFGSLEIALVSILQTCGAFRILSLWSPLLCRSLKARVSLINTGPLQLHACRTLWVLCVAHIPTFETRSTLLLLMLRSLLRTLKNHGELGITRIDVYPVTFATTVASRASGVAANRFSQTSGTMFVSWSLIALLSSFSKQRIVLVDVARLKELTTGAFWAKGVAVGSVADAASAFLVLRLCSPLLHCSDKIGAFWIHAASVPV